jgi:hypothetical protein
MDLEFAVNGERFKIDSVDPSTTLLEFLRLNTPFKSVKLGCGEGKISISLLCFYVLVLILFLTNCYKRDSFMSGNNLYVLLKPCVMSYFLPEELVKLT